MNCGLLCIGDELLDGRTINTNANWLGKQLNDLGHKLQQVITCKDNTKEICDALKYLTQKNDFTFTSGGIGPTEDDISVESISHFLNQKLFLDQDELNRIQELYNKRNIKMLDNSKRQAFKPKEASFITNPFGIASGFFWKNEKILCLAGVPSEFKGIFSQFVKLNPDFDERQTSVDSVVWNFFAVPESLLDQRASKLPRSENAYTTYRIFYPCCEMRLMNETNQKVIGAWKKEFDHDAYSFIQGQKLEHVLFEKLKQNNLDLICIESCTGGLISKTITDVPGSSEIFSGGIITYSNELKQKVGVKSKSLNDFGAVSREVVKEMMLSGLNYIPKRSDKKRIVIAISGVAGPDGGSKEKPIGTVHIGVSLENEKENFKLLELGKRTRNQIRELSSQFALDLAINLL